MAAAPFRERRFRGWASLLPPCPNPRRSGRGHPGTGDCSRCGFAGVARRGRWPGTDEVPGQPRNGSGKARCRQPADEGPGL